MRDTRLDALRGIAALLVVLTHAVNALGGPLDALQYRYFSPGIFGVVLFFGVSGIVIPEAHRRARSTSVYLWRRVVRIYPAYLVGLSAALLALPESMRALPSILAHLTMLPDLFGVTRLNGVFWSLEIELLFYLLIAARWKGNPLPWLLLAAATGWAAPLCIATIGCAMRPTRMALILTSLCWMLIPGLLLGVHIAAALAVPAFPLLRRLPMPPVFAHLGTISYGVYLLHIPIIWSMPPALWLPLTLAGATVLHIVIERPFASKSARC